MVKIEIKNRFTGKVIFEYSKENNTIAETVKEFIRKEIADGKSRADLRWADLSEANLSKADLSGADLSEANLSKADLSGAYLRWADLSEADLSGADLSEANLSKADLSGANLSKANLRWANLSNANLRWANLRWANLSGANLSKANLSEANLSNANLSNANLSRADLSEADLSEANLSNANLSVIKNDFWAKLLKLKNEIPAFKEKIIAGEIDGSCYEGECCCFVGTMAKIKHLDYQKLEGVYPDSGSPTERWFMGISKGMKPETHEIVKITLEWIEEFEMWLNK